jgi:hypothetical protein
MAVAADSLTQKSRMSFFMTRLDGTAVNRE